MVVYNGPRNPNVVESKRISYKELEVFGISAGGKKFDPEGPFKKVTLQCADRTLPKGADGRYPSVFIDFFGHKDDDGKVVPFRLGIFPLLNEIDQINRAGKNYIVSIPNVQYRKLKSDKAKSGYRDEYTIDPKVLSDPNFRLLKIVDRPPKKQDGLKSSN